jgi:3-hydroxymyristoyl/3-hydroxydecanoyl-(acyl carrier protein) dehydratase
MTRSLHAPHSFTIGADHPSLPGHFPGQPLVPGVVLLEAALAPLRQPGDRRIAKLEAAKFLAPVRFGEPVIVTFADDGADRIRLDATAAGTTVLRCRVRLGAAA